MKAAYEQYIACSLVLAVMGACTASEPVAAAPKPVEQTEDTADGTVDTATVETGDTAVWTTTGTPWLRADDASPGTVAQGADMAIAPDGTLLVSWVVDEDLRIARSTDGGVSFEPSAVVDGPEEPIVDWWSGPALSTDGSSVILVSPARAAVGVRGYIWRADYATMTFQPGQWYGEGLVEMITGALAPDGDLWVTWLEYDGGAQVLLANSTLGYEGTNINAPLGTPSCECCQLDLTFSSDAKPLVAWRNNDTNIRNIAVASGSPGAATVANQVVATGTDWLTFSCPVQGPKIAQTASGAYLLAWSDDSAGFSTVWVVSSADFVNWSPERDVAPNQGSGRNSPRLAVAESGRVYLIFAQPGSYWLTWSDDDGATWSTPEEQRVVGQAVDRADLVVGAGQTWIEGESGGQVWIRQLE